MGDTVIEILSVRSSYTTYRLSLIVGFAVLALATVDRLLPSPASPPALAYRIIRLSARMWGLLPAHAWSLQALFRVADLEGGVTTADLLPPAVLAEALWTLVLSLVFICLIQGAVFLVSPSARAAIRGTGGLFLAGPVVGVLGALFGYSWLVLFHLRWWA